MALAFALAFAAGKSRRPPGPAPLPAWAVTRADAAFDRRLAVALSQLEGTRTGSMVLAGIASSGRKVVFRPWKLPAGSSSAAPDGAVVWWNPDFGAPETPAFVALHHELVHALQSLHGIEHEEERSEPSVIGLREFAGSPLSENALRRELGLPQRTSHEALPGFTEDEMARRFHAAYLDQDYVKSRLPPANSKGSLFPKIEATIPPWPMEKDSP